MSEVTAVYAIREYKTTGINELDAQHLEDLKKDFPNAPYVCIMVFQTKTGDIEEAERIARNNNYEIKGIATGIVYAFGPGKGQPPGSGSNLKDDK
ncbi:MAG: hypothetical protein IPG86_17905 [Chitinophagaceae bacterium]|nr:hypothetical protein [Chitinophagaceae bacterium]